MKSLQARKFFIFSYFRPQAGAISKFVDASALFWLM